jgi:hypothetical protein
MKEPMPNLDREVKKKRRKPLEDEEAWKMVTTCAAAKQTTAQRRRQEDGKRTAPEEATIFPFLPPSSPLSSFPAFPSFLLSSIFSCRELVKLHYSVNVSCTTIEIHCYI